MKTLFLIPARIGSKRIPKKNIKELDSKPLIIYSIEEAMKLTQDEHISVSADSREIIDIAEKTGLKVPFVRPAHLATDEAISLDVIYHALNFYEQKGLFYDTLVLLQPTSPFRKARHIKEAIELYHADLDMVVSVKKTHSNPYLTLFEENTQGFLQKSKKGDFQRRQDAPDVWEYNGAIYVINVASLKKHNNLQLPKTVKYEMDDISSLDLDTPLDWEFCEFLMQKKMFEN